jgi:hypothetical protein
VVKVAFDAVAPLPARSLTPLVTATSYVVPLAKGAAGRKFTVLSW